MSNQEEPEKNNKNVLEKQDSVEMSSQLSSTFTEDSLNTDSGSDKDRTARSRTSHDQDNLDTNKTGESVETSDTETDLVTTAVLIQSPGSDQSSLEREKQEDLEVFGLPADMYASYENNDHHDDDDEEFFFDSDLNLEANIDDHIVAAELLRPERLDTVEEVSEPPSESINSLPHDGVRWPEQQSQHTSLSTDQLASLNSLADTEDGKEEMFSQAEMEFRNSFRSLDRANILRSQVSEDRSLSTIENIGKKVGLEPQELTYVQNPFEIFQKPQTSSQNKREPGDSVKTVTVTQSVLTSPEKPLLSSSDRSDRVVISSSSESVSTSKTVISSSETTIKSETRTQHRIAQQLEEVRLGIFKLLSESDDEEKVNVNVGDVKVKDFAELGVAPLEEETPGYQADEEEDDSHEDSASHSVEINTVNIVPDTGDIMGCVSADKEDRGTDSGIDRGQGSSRAASAEGWLARLTNRVGGHQASRSQTSTPDRVRRRGSSAPDSPRDGGFPDGGLEMRVRELWLRLAQMETEKLRAVEVAVEEERKRGMEIVTKERLVIDREKREIKQEKEKINKDREALNDQILMFQQTQARESDLINKLQAKLVKYKSEAAEGGVLVEQLSAQARNDQLVIREHNDKIDLLNQQLETDKVLHASEIQELKIKIEERGEKVNTLEALNDALRNELVENKEISDRLESELDFIKQELKLSRQEIDLLNVGATGSGGQDIQELLNLSRSVSAIRRQYHDMKHETVKEINRMKVEMAEKARMLSTACLEVYSSSNYIRDSQGNKILVGDIKELWEKLERVKLEKKVEEERADQLEADKEQLRRELRMSDQKYEDMKLTVEEMKNTNDKDATDGDRAPSRFGVLEAENEALKSTIQDIASMVINDKDDDEAKSPRRPRPLAPTSVGRRSRSGSTDPSQVTAAVQASLNNKQTQLYQIRTKYSAMKERYESEVKNCQEWRDKANEAFRDLAVKTSSLVAAEKEGTVSKEMTEMLQDRLDKASKEIRTVSDELSNAMEEILNLNRKLDENVKMKDVVEKKLNDLKSELIVKEKTLKSNEELFSFKETIIKKLTVEKNNYAEEISSLKERLVSVEKDQERLEMERTDKETTITEEKKIRNETSIEIRKMRQQETYLLDQIAQKDNFEKKLRNDLVSNETIISSLKTEILDYEKKISQKDNEITKLNSIISEYQQSKDEVDANVKQLKREKNDLTNQVTSISLRKDAINDEYIHIREEYQILKEQLDSFHKSFSMTSGAKDKLSEKLLLKEKECREFEIKLKALEDELEREIIISEDIRLEYESSEERNKELEKEIEKKSESAKQLNNSIANLKLKLFESNRNLSEYQEKTELEFEMEKRKLEKDMKKSKEEYNNNVRDLEDEMELLRDKLERKRISEAKLLKDGFKAEKERFEEEIDYLTRQLDNLRLKSNESFAIAENSRNTADKLAETEESLAEEKLKYLTGAIEQLKKELSSEKVEGLKRLNKEKERNMDLDYQIRSLKQKLDTADDDRNSLKESLEKEIRKLKNEKLRSDQEGNEIKLKSKLSDNTIEDLQQKIETLNEEKHSLNSALINEKSVVESLQTQISEKNKKIQEKILEKHKEVEVLEKKIETFEINEKTLLEEIEEAKEELIKNQSEVSTSSNIQFLQSKISELTLELDLTKKRLKESDDGKEKEEGTVSQLRKALHTAEFEKSKLENHLIELREQVELDTDRRDGQVKAFQTSVQESRDRERKLEDIRHNLELELNLKNQEIQELLYKLELLDNKLKEQNELILKLEQSKTDHDAKLSSIASVLNQTGYYGSRSGTPVRSRVRIRSGSDLRDADCVKNRIRDLVNKLEKVEKEKEEMLGRIEMLKLTNENLILNSGKLEEDKENAEDKLRSCQLQLQKLESKVSMNDESLAEKEESVEKFKVLVRSAEKRVKELSTQLDETNQRRQTLEDLEKEIRAKEQKAKLDSSRLGGSLREVEEELEKVQREKFMLGEELNKLHSAVRQKDELLQASQNRSSQLSSDCEQLERQLEQLTSQLSQLQGDSGRRGRVEQELQFKVEHLQRQLSEKSEVDGVVQDQNSYLQRQVMELDQERKLLEERLENSKSAVKESRGQVKDLENSMSDMTKRLSDAERGRYEAEQRLAQAGCNVGADNYLKEELNKTRKENIGLTEKVKELEKKVKRVKTERIERSEINNSKMLSDFSSERIVRTQIPLMSGRGAGGAESPDVGEHLVRIRILEQEVERHLRRVKTLEHQLEEVEQQQKTRLEEMIQERKMERERDHTRHTSSLKQLEHSLNSRERMYKERIAGLEDQVHLLRDQLTKEARSRRSFIASSQVLSNDVSELRRQLDQSLDIVQNSSQAGLESGILDRESSRLEQTIARQGRDHLSRLTPSKRPASPADRLRSSSLETFRLGPSTSTPIRRNLEPSFRSPLLTSSALRSEEHQPRSQGGLRRSSTEFDKHANLTS